MFSKTETAIICMHRLLLHSFTQIPCLYEFFQSLVPHPLCFNFVFAQDIRCKSAYISCSHSHSTRFWPVFGCELFFSRLTTCSQWSQWKIHETQERKETRKNGTREQKHSDQKSLKHRTLNTETLLMQREKGETDMQWLVLHLHTLTRVVCVTHVLFYEKKDHKNTKRCAFVRKKTFWWAKVVSFANHTFSDCESHLKTPINHQISFRYECL